MSEKKRMNVLLVRTISDTYIISPPIGLGYLATAVRRAGHNVNILDCVKERMSFDGLESFVRNEKFDMIGFQVWSCDLPSVRKSMEIVRRNCPGAVIVAGGAHPSSLPVETMAHLPEADFAFRGEAEVGLPLLLDRLSRNKSADLTAIPGLIWREGAGVRVNPPIFCDDLDQFGLPAWDLMDPSKYPHAPHQGFARAFPTAPIVITRGCPFLCTFCATHSINGKKIRSRSLESVIEEIRLLKDRYGVKEIHIEDDNFTFNREFVQKFCKRMIDGKYGLYWHCSSGVRLDSLDKETLSLMKKALCYTLTIAIESGSQRVLDLMQKSLTIGKIRDKVALLNEAGYVPTGLFMFGFPGETKKEMEETLRFAMGLGLKRAQFALFHPLPGSRVFEELKARGELDDLDWTKLKPSEAAYESKELSRQELKGFQRKAFLKFHLRPKILWYQVKDINSVDNFIFLFKRAVDMLFSGER